MIPVLLLLAACTGREPGDAACRTFAPDPWDPEWEDDVRLDEATAAWAAIGGATVDSAATDGCVAAPCVRVEGAGGAEAPLLLNRGMSHRLTGTVVTDVPATLTITHTSEEGVTRTMVAVALEPGSTELDETFTVDGTGEQAAVDVAMDDPGVVILDDIAVTGQRWAETADPPAGTVHLGFLIHVEDGEFPIDRATWESVARILADLSGMLAKHGAKLGIQADSSFVRGTTTWDPTWFAARRDEGAGWSVHIHDEDSALDTEQALRDGRAALREAGVATTDFNGGFGSAPWLKARSAGFVSFTAYKDPATQLGLPHAQVQPWRPADGVGADDPDAFLEDDPDGPLLYLPGHDIREVDHSRFPTAASHVVGQVLAHAKPDDVNVWYFVLHIDGFGPPGDDPTAEADYYADEFPTDLAYYDQFLTDYADPLVDDGYLVYDTPMGMAQAWSEWNAPCERE